MILIRCYYKSSYSKTTINTLNSNISLLRCRCIYNLAFDPTPLQIVFDHCHSENLVEVNLQSFKNTNTQFIQTSHSLLVTSWLHYDPIVIRYVCMTTTLQLVEIYNTEHSIAGRDIQHHSTIFESQLGRNKYKSRERERGMVANWSVKSTVSESSDPSSNPVGVLMFLR